MGSVADKIAKKVLLSDGSKVVDLATWREGRKMTLEPGLGLGNDGIVLGKLAGHDSCHARYVLGQHVASFIAESIFRDERPGYIAVRTSITTASELKS